MFRANHTVATRHYILVQTHRTPDTRGLAVSHGAGQTRPHRVTKQGDMWEILSLPLSVAVTTLKVLWRQS